MKPTGQQLAGLPPAPDPRAFGVSERALPLTDQQPLLRAREVAQVLGVSPRVIYSWVATKVIPPEAVVRVGRAVYIKRAALESWLAGRTGGGT